MKLIKYLSAIVCACALVAVATAADDKKADAKELPKCCAAAKAKGEECKHECCVAAKKEGKICEKCAKPAKKEKAS